VVPDSKYADFEAMEALRVAQVESLTQKDSKWSIFRQLYLVINAIVAPLLPRAGMNRWGYVQPHRKEGPREGPPHNIREELVTGAHAKARYHEDGYGRPTR
jgi:hypothetical protein